MMDLTLLVRNEFNMRENLHLIEANKGIETLGVFIALNRDMNNKITLLNKKIGKWVNTIKRRRLSSYKMLLYIHATIIKTIKYPLLATTLSE